MNLGKVGVRIEKRERGKEDGFRLVYGKNRRESLSIVSGGGDSVSRMKVQGDSVNAKVKEMKERANVPFHIPTMRRPQEKFNIWVNNLNQPFQHVWLQRSEDNQRFLHPLESLSVLDFVHKDIGDVELVKPSSLEETPFKLVEEVKDLKELAAKFRSENEFAASSVLKLERNSLEYLLQRFCGVAANKELISQLIEDIRIQTGDYAPFPMRCLDLREKICSIC